MATYLVLIYGDEQRWSDATEQWQEQNAVAHRAFAAAAGPALLGGAELVSTAGATSVRRGPDGDVMITDGPFAESKEALGGYYLLDVPDLDAALRLAALVPEATAPFSGVEVRPVRDLDA